ncbi:hypothetical protein B5F07_05045 [Lachnoclostridium sp. An169]|nr:hypothetical protein B5F07_05045 [Lachnoclostridium sp. An169]
MKMVWMYTICIHAIFAHGKPAVNMLLYIRSMKDKRKGTCIKKSLRSNTSREKMLPVNSVLTAEAADKEEK